MITNLKIEHFKSIDALDIECNRINIFIGEPNTGKSNILEALALFTFFDQHLEGHPEKLATYVRFKDLSNLFTDGIMDNDISITIKRFDPHKQNIFENNTFENKIFEKNEKISVQSLPDRYRFFYQILKNSEIINKGSYDFNFFGEIMVRGGGPGVPTMIKYYLYQELPEYNGLKTNSLTPPFGENLVALIQAHKPLRKKVSDILKAEGYRLLIKPHGKQIEIIKDIDDVSFGYPYTILSDTLKRIIFYTLAIHSNKNATLILEEPESYTFPYYTKHLAEDIALDDQNQYFIATHNPYLLRSIIEKAPKDKVNIFVTTVKDYLTKVTKIDAKKLPDLLDSDPFFNLSSFIGEEGG